MNIIEMTQQGALAIARWGLHYKHNHAAAGFNQADWDLLVQNELWSADQRRRIPTILHQAINLALELAGLPAEPLPGQYVAAIICVLIAPCNRMVAAECAPSTYDAVSATGLDGPAKFQPLPPWQMRSLILIYTSGHLPDLTHTWPLELQEESRRSAASTDPRPTA